MDKSGKRPAYLQARRGDENKVSGATPRQVPALVVNQWLPGWEKIDFDVGEHRAKPEKHFYLISLPARELRSLSGIARRVAKDAAPRTEDLGIQRSA